MFSELIVNQEKGKHLSIAGAFDRIWDARNNSVIYCKKK